MRAKEILSEYIIIGKSNPEFKKTYVFVHQAKYALFVNANDYEELMFGNGVRFELTHQGKEKIHKILQTLDFNEYYGSLEEALMPFADDIKTIVLNNVVFKSNYHKINSEEVKEFFYKLLAGKPSEDIVESLAYKLRYGANIKTNKDIDRIFDNETYLAVASPTNYIVIDHDNKTIKREDCSKRYQTRMRGYSAYGSNKAYILVGYDYSIDRLTYAKLVKQIKDFFPEYKVLEFDDSTATKESLLRILSGRGKVVAYHGTSNAIFKKIKKTGGLIPGLGPDYWDKIEGHSEKLVYLSLQPETARKYAVRASRTNPYVILQVTVHDLSRIVFDEDSLLSAIDSFFESERRSDKAVQKLLYKAFGNVGQWDLKHDIKQYITDNSLTKEQQQVINYIKYFALKKMRELSFGYRGTIPLKNISIYEEGRSKRYDTKTFDQDYEEVVGSIRTLK